MKVKAHRKLSGFFLDYIISWEFLSRYFVQYLAAASVLKSVKAYRYNRIMFWILPKI